MDDMGGVRQMVDGKIMDIKMRETENSRVHTHTHGRGYSCLLSPQGLPSGRRGA